MTYNGMPGCSSTWHMEFRLENILECSMYKQKDRMPTEMVINWLRNNLKSFVIPHSTYKQGHLTVLRNQTNRTRKELYLLANCRE